LSGPTCAKRSIVARLASIAAIRPESASFSSRRVLSFSADRERAAARSFRETLALDADRGGVDRRRQAAQHDLRGALHQLRLAEPRHHRPVRKDRDAVDPAGQLGLGGGGEAGRQDQGGGYVASHRNHPLQIAITRP
jgi:hypothetical protein